MNNDHIQIHEVQPDDFRKGLLAGEVRPHDVEIIIRFKDGKTATGKVSWDDIKSIYDHHNVCAVKEVYELVVESNLSH